jgi:hypothetical protein
MTETAEPRDKAQDTIAIASASMCHDFVAVLLEELRNMPAHWATLAEDRQQKILETLKTKVRGGVEKAAAIMMRSEFQAVEATLEYVSRKKGFSAGISVKTDALCRHALVDAVGGRVLVVIADPARWAERMDELKAKGNQADLFDPAANYDPTRDQPGYRRDQDPLLTTGKSWDALKHDLFGPSFADDPPIEGDTSLDPEQHRAAELIELQEQLSARTVAIVSLGFLKSRSPEEIAELHRWFDFYTGKTTPFTTDDIPDRPAWLPLPPAMPPAA